MTGEASVPPWARLNGKKRVYSIRHLQLPTHHGERIRVPAERLLMSRQPAAHPEGALGDAMES